MKQYKHQDHLNLQVGSQNCRGNGLIHFATAEADKNHHCTLKKTRLAPFLNSKYQLMK